MCDRPTKTLEVHPKVGSIDPYGEFVITVKRDALLKEELE
jgi:hypothetical protein